MPCATSLPRNQPEMLTFVDLPAATGWERAERDLALPGNAFRRGAGRRLASLPSLKGPGGVRERVVDSVEMKTRVVEQARRSWFG